MRLLRSTLAALIAILLLHGVPALAQSADEPAPQVTIDKSKLLVQPRGSGEEALRTRFIDDPALWIQEEQRVYYRALREAFDRRRRTMTAMLNEIDGVECLEPKGAFYTFPNIRATGMTSEAFAEGLLKEEKVAVVPGSAFGASGEGFVRACYATSLEQLKEAMERIARFTDRHRVGPE